MNSGVETASPTKAGIDIGNSGGTAENMFYNPDFVDKINDIQDQFNKLLEERNANSPTKIVGGGLNYSVP